MSAVVAFEMVRFVWYVATPYTNYADGLEAAYRDAVRNTTDLVVTGIGVFSPIVHLHPIGEAGQLGNDPQFWNEINLRYMARCDGLVIVRMPGYRESRGVKFEHSWFRDQGKPITLIDHRSEGVSFDHARKTHINGAIRGALATFFS
jgi:hypothetical protein